VFVTQGGSKQKACNCPSAPVPRVKLGPICNPNHLTPPNNPEDGEIQFNRFGNLRSQVMTSCNLYSNLHSQQKEARYFSPLRHAIDIYLLPTVGRRYTMSACAGQPLCLKYPHWLLYIKTLLCLVSMFCHFLQLL
jgi:hypothetical protein